MKKFAIILASSLLITANLYSQKINDNYVLNIQKTTEQIEIDGKMNEETWKNASIAGDFYSILPMDTNFAKVKTEVRMAYDDQFIYMIVVCHHPENQEYIVESLRRDWSFGKNDNFIFFMDPFDDQTNGYTFGTNAAGAQWDGMLFQGGSANLSWDNKWFSKVTQYSDKYIFELAIPFKSIRYKKGIQKWGINFSRLDLKSTEKSAWAPVPRQFPSASLAYTGTLQWDAPPPASNNNISLIPYVLGGGSKNYENNTAPQGNFDVGMDAKVAVTSSLNLDLTVNPDFSQVEVDRQVTNLDRFELFFPEKRQFFLENADLFANFGFDNIRPFFSRRIGISYDSAISQIIQNKIHYGARLSGKINQNWRIGVMNMQTAKQEDIGLPAQNFTTISLQRKVFSRSNIGLIINNKQSVNYTYDPLSTFQEYSEYNRNIGLEYNLASSNNLWTGKAFGLKSFTPGINSKDYSYGA
ncbi:MAG: carbohydrate binding family 9 domain-containing protein, partial [Cyclobacteriaceae bacterium]|nr:carbohydrate binding family 9 domain-containing protein [Cyclobacteriaceae bacterium]